MYTMDITEKLDRLEEHKQKVEKMEVIGKWNKMIRGMLWKYNKVQAKQDKLQRMLILGKWNILTRRMVGLHVNQARWGKLILKMYAQKGEEFGLNIKQSFKTETLLQRL